MRGTQQNIFHTSAVGVNVNILLHDFSQRKILETINCWVMKSLILIDHLQALERVVTALIYVRLRVF